MRRYHFLTFLSLFLMAWSSTTWSDSMRGTATTLSKDQFSYSKCIDVAATYREKLTYDELCRYGPACPSVKSNKKYESYCIYNNLSECFENKAWKTANQLLEIPSRTKIGLVTQGLSFKNGTRTGQTCGYYN